MRDILKKIYIVILDLMKTIVSLIMVMLFSSYKAARNLKRLSRVGEGKDAFVLANGPALKGVIDKYLDFLQRNDCIVLNFFGNTKEFWMVRPQYYVLLDPGFFGGEAHAVFNEKYIQIAENFNKVDWDMVLFIPSSTNARKNFEAKVQNKHITLVPFNSTRVEGFRGFRNFMYKHNLGLPSTKNVLFPAIIRMINMGYNHVYLYGAEFSWVKTYNVDEKNGKIFTDDVHFYGSDRIYLDQGRFCFDIGCFHEALLCTYMIQDYAESTGHPVINRTKGSFIDAFPYENPDKQSYGHE